MYIRTHLTSKYWRHVWFLSVFLPIRRATFVYTPDKTTHTTVFPPQILVLCVLWCRHLEALLVGSAWIHLQMPPAISPNIWQYRRSWSASRCPMCTRRMETDLQDYPHSRLHSDRQKISSHFRLFHKFHFPGWNCWCFCTCYSIVVDIWRHCVVSVSYLKIVRWNLSKTDTP